VTAGSQCDRRCGSSAFLLVLAVGVVDCVLELGQVGVECAEQALEGAPADVAPAALDAGEIGGRDVGARGQLLLCEFGSGAKDAQGSSDIGLSGTYHIVKITLRWITRNIFGARAGRTAGRRGTRSRRLQARREPYPQGTDFFLVISSLWSLPSREGGIDVNIDESESVWRLDRLGMVVV
jgi:hypothetical protein